MYSSRPTKTITDIGLSNFPFTIINKSLVFTEITLHLVCHWPPILGKKFKEPTTLALCRVQTSYH